MDSDLDCVGISTCCNAPVHRYVQRGRRKSWTGGYAESDEEELICSGCGKEIFADDILDAMDEP